MDTSIDTTRSPRLRLLIDTNVFIALETYSRDTPAGSAPAAQLARLVRLVRRQGHRIVVHPATRDDLLRGRDAWRHAERLAESDVYGMLAEVPVPAALIDVIGASAPGTKEHRDSRLLAALNARAVTYLISEDDGLRRRAAYAGLADSVLTIDEAVQLLAGFDPAVFASPPTVQHIPAAALGAEAIFDGLRSPDEVLTDSDAWDSTVVPGEFGGYTALMLVKRWEPDCRLGFTQPVRKVAAFTVADGHADRAYGELLLKSLFVAAAEDGVATLYVEVSPTSQARMDLLHDFGFAETGHRTDRGDLVLAKGRRPPEGTNALSALDYHVAFGPPAIAGTGNVFIVPIEPRWHRHVFPDAPRERAVGQQLVLPGLSLPDEAHPSGNALRKAYVWPGKVARLEPGDTLLFYRSHDLKAATAVGVVERTLRSADAHLIMSFLGQRTVYTPDHIAELCRRSGTGALAILFRHDRFIEPPWRRGDLLQHDVVGSRPQSISQVRGDGAAWVHQRLTMR